MSRMIGRTEPRAGTLISMPSAPSASTSTTESSSTSRRSTIAWIDAMPRNTLNGTFTDLLRLGQHHRFLHGVARRLRRAGEHAAEHDRVAAEQQRLDDRAVALDAAVGDERHAAAGRRRGTRRAPATCGTPKFVLSRVVQPPPGPMPTLMPLTPRSARNATPSAVATLPAISSTSPNRVAERLDRARHHHRMAVGDVDDDARRRRRG